MKRLQQQFRDLVGKNYSKADGTIEKNLGNLDRLAVRISEKYGLENAQNLKTKHVRGVFQDMREEGLSASTIAAYATVARQVAEAIGKTNIVPSNEDLGASRAGERLKPGGLDHGRADKIQAALDERAGWQGLAYEMQRAFGLRLRESLLSVNVIKRQGGYYLEVKGGKGGRPRQLAVSTSDQWAATEGVAAHLARTGQRSLVPNHMTLRQGYDAQRNAIAAAGGTKANNANSHLARHNWAQNQKAAGASDKALAADLGHGREDVVRHYVPTD